jgi:hypothetical protein
MGKKQRGTKPPTLPKTREERTQDIENLKAKLVQSGLDADLSRITDIYDRMDNFVETGNGDSGSIALTGYQRALDYAFPTRKNTVSSIRIRHTG